MAKAKSTVRVLTHKDVVKGFSVANMTVYNWRHGTPTKTPLPYTQGANGHLEYVESEVIAWAKKNGVAFTSPKQQDANKRPGPVAKHKTAKPKAPKTKGGVRANGDPGDPPTDPKPPIKVPARREAPADKQEQPNKSLKKAALKTIKSKHDPFIDSITKKLAQKPQTASKPSKATHRAT